MRTTTTPRTAALVLAAVLGAYLFPIIPAHAMCAASQPTIGVIHSVQAADNTYGSDVSAVTIDYGDYFDASSFPSGVTSIDSYNALAQAYKQNNYRVPQQYAFVLSPNAGQYQAPTQINVTTSALNTISYNVGDIIIIGPPGTCGGNGFTGFFGTDGVIQAAISYNPMYFSYTYGSETLSLAASTQQYGCAATNYVGQASTVCKVPITYSIRGVNQTIKPGVSATIDNSVFQRINLIGSTYTTLSGGMWVEDFSPTAMLNTITFNSSSVPPKPKPRPLPPLQKCMQISHNLSLDDSDDDTGGDVTVLQQFLAQDSSIYPEGRVTGYFGPATRRAVKRWQARAGIVSSGDEESTGYGYVGRKTRAAMQASCKDVRPKPNGNLSASPAGGWAPLTVTFTALTPADNTSSISTYSIDFGDGSPAMSATYGQCAYALNASAPTDSSTSATTMPASVLLCNPGSMTQVHTYTSNGTYTATLKRIGNGYNYGNAGCTGNCAYIAGIASQGDTTVLGTVTIRIGGTPEPVPSISASPTFGTAPLSTVFTATGLTNKYFYYIDFGDGVASDPLSAASPSASHTYKSAGNYSSILMQATNVCYASTNPCTQPEPTNWKAVAWQTFLIDSGSTGTPVISGLDAPTSLTVGQSGTWTVHATAPSGTTISYYVVWGDEPVTNPTATNAQAAPATVNTNSTFTHTYSSAGTYTPTFYASNNSGSAKTSASVQVSATSVFVPNNTIPAAATNQYAALIPLYGYADGVTLARCSKTGVNPIYVASGSKQNNLIGADYYYSSDGTLLSSVSRTATEIYGGSGDGGGGVVGYSANPPSGSPPTGITTYSCVQVAQVKYNTVDYQSSN